MTTFDFAAHLTRQREWSGRTFGPGPRTQGVVAHIRKELDEVLADPTDLTEWIDVAILALDGAWRAGATPDQIIATLVAKQTRNEGRRWPDWRTASEDQPIEHVRICNAPVGSRPFWMGPDQYDQCRCILPAGHEPVTGDSTDSGHACDHSTVEQRATS